jgi:hypothetical protein
MEDLRDENQMMRKILETKSINKASEIEELRKGLEAYK